MNDGQAASQPVEQKMQSVAHRASRRATQFAGTLGELCLVHREDLRYVHHTGLRKVGLALLQKDIAWRVRPA